MTCCKMTTQRIQEGGAPESIFVLTVPLLEEIWMRTRKKGQGIVEFAVILPILVLLVMGALELGRAFYLKIVLTGAAREGAYFLSYHPEDKTNCDAGVCYQDSITAVKNESNLSGIVVTPADITFECPACTSGNLLTVTVTKNVKLIWWQLPLSGRVRMRVQ